MSKKDKRQRLMLTLPPELHDVLYRISQLSGAAMSGLCVQFLQEAIPAFEAIATSLEQIQGKSADSFDTLVRMLSEAQLKVAETQLGVLDAKQHMRRTPTHKDELGDENGQE